MKTYPEMNKEIINLLRVNTENPVSMYAAQRIVELEAEVELLRETLEWYGSLANWMDADPPDYNSRAAHDKGAKARRALGKE